MNAKIIAVIIIIITGNFQFVLNDFYSAIVHLTPLINTNNLLVKTLEEYVENEEIRLSKVKQFLSLYKQIEDNSKRNGKEKYLENPINSFLLIKRLTSDWNKVKQLINIDVKNVEKIIEKVESNAEFPEKEELDGASMALMRIQNTYKLDLTHLSKGIIAYNQQTSQINISVNAMHFDDCVELGIQAYKHKQYNNSVKWLQLGLDSGLNDQQFNTDHKLRIYENLVNSYEKIPDVSNSEMYRKKILEINPNHNFSNHNLFNKNDHNIDSFGDVNNIESLCRGDTRLTAKHISRLNCHFLNTSTIPYLRLSRIRVEIVLKDPQVVMFHNVISNREIKLLKSIAMPALKRAQVLDSGQSGPGVVNYRISQSAFFSDNRHTVFKQLSQRIKLITGLETSTAEPLQVGNYGIGGHYAPHHDYLNIENPAEYMTVREHGNRIATWMFYMSDVDAGGATVFLNLNVTVWPIKGSALFWYNLHKSGRVDERTLHAACPVLVGSKWVANKWIYEFGQEFRRKCELNSKN